MSGFQSLDPSHWVPVNTLIETSEMSAEDGMFYPQYEGAVVNR
jgi:hypothetical protein